MSNEPPPTHLILSGLHGGVRYRFRLDEGTHSVGSKLANRICLDVPGISKHHAVLKPKGQDVFVEDLASKNGTFINGERIQSATLEPGDMLRFGPLSLSLEECTAEAGQLAIVLENSRIKTATGAPEETPQIDDGASNLLAEAAATELVFPPDWLPGESPAMASFLSQVRRVADSDLPVLLLGETGSGKEGAAQTIHLSSSRATGSFVAINCAAIPTDLLESELFGIGKGVATGVEGRVGRFMEAQSGTLFLDEIGDMPATLQAKLLRVLQEGEIQPVGMSPQPLDVRVIAATHTDPAEAMVAGRFRRDLFYRLAGAALHLPPLRQRQADIPDLVGFFLARAIRKTTRDVRGFTVAAMRRAVDYPWPGNVRQLQHAVERWVHQCPQHQVIEAELVAEDLAATMDEANAAAPDPLGDRRLPQAESTPDFDVKSWPSLDLVSVEKEMVREALRRAEGKLTQAAKMLGLTRQALRRRIARHGIRTGQDPRTPSSSS